MCHMVGRQPQYTSPKLRLLAILLSRLQGSIEIEIPAERITQETVRAFLNEADTLLNAATTNSTVCDLYGLARAFQAKTDCNWLNTLC